MASAIKAYVFKFRKKKLTSIGVYGVPRNKHKRRSFKAYRGQGRP